MPYVNIPIKNKTFKFLIDTGASSSLCKPSLISNKFIKKINPHTLRALNNETEINQRVDTTLFKIFGNDAPPVSYFLYDFHEYFDGMIGNDILSTHGFIIDLKNNLLIRGQIKVKIQFKPLIKQYQSTLNAGVHKVKIPVDVQKGDVLIEEQTCGKAVIIGGLYKAIDYEADVMIECKSNVKITFNQPAKTCDVNMIEVNHTTVQNKKLDCNSIRDKIRTNHLNNEEEKSLLKLLSTYEDILHQDGQQLTFTNKVKHEIKTKDEIPVYTRSYRYPYVHKEEIQKQINAMLDQQIIRPSYSPWSSPIWVVPKKADAANVQKWRLVVDYRKLNDKTIDDRYPLPNISEILDKIGKSMYFTTIDLASGFHQLEVHENDIPKTAFTVEHGHYEFTRMPFGLKNAPATFQRVMDEVLKDLQNKVCLVYMDDIIIYSTSLDEHMINLKKVLDALRGANLKIQLDKSEFLQKEVSFLGHIVTREGIKPNPDKIKAVQNYPIPKSQKEIKQFLGLLGYYRKFIKDFARLTKPLTIKLKKDERINITEDSYRNCFETCKQMLLSDPILQYPDFTKPFLLTTDASNFALGAVLSQIINGQEHPLCYASRTLNEHEINYSTIEKELLAIVWGTKYFRPYLYGRKFKIITDHKPLNWLMSLKEPNSKLVRWRLRLEEYDYSIEFKPGKTNNNADALSRIPVEININDSSSSSTGATAHSADSDHTDLIPISMSSLNNFKYQYIFIKTESGPTSVKQEKPFGYLRKTIRSKDFNEDSLVQTIKLHFNPKQINAIFVEETDLFLKIQGAYRKHFARNKLFRILRCTTFKRDILEETQQDSIIEQYHKENNHRGISETVEHLKRSIFFPKLHQKVTLFINQCDVCQTNKYERKPEKIQFKLTQTPKQPLEIVHCDVFFMKKGEPIITIIDKFSRYAQAFILESRNTPHIKEQLLKYFSLFGKPKLIITDQERAITTIEIKEFLTSNNIQIHFTSVNSSTSNSPVERFHSTLAEHLRIIINTEKIKFSDALCKALFAYNNSINSITKYTPFELFFGRKIDEPLDLDIAKIKAKKIDMQADAYRNSLIKKIKYITKKNENRTKPIHISPETAYLRTKTINKLQPRNKKIAINRQKRRNIYDMTDIKHHKSKINRPRNLLLQGMSSTTSNLPTGHTRHDDESGTSDSSDEQSSFVQRPL